MRLIILACLISLVAAVPLQEKRQTDVAASFVLPSSPSGFTPGVFPKESFTASFVRPTGSHSSGPHGTESFMHPTGTFAAPSGGFSGSFVRPTVSRPHQTYATGAPPVPASSAVVARNDEAPTGAHTPGSHPTGSFTGTLELPTGTLVHSRPTGTFVRPTGTSGGPAGTPSVRPTGVSVRPSGSGKSGGEFPPTPTATVEPAIPSTGDETYLEGASSTLTTDLSSE